MTENTEERDVTTTVDATDAPARTDPPGRKASGDDTPTSAGKTYSEAEVNAMITARLTKHEKALRKSWEDEQAEARRQAEMTAEERARAAEESARKALEEADVRVRAAERRAALTGVVTNPERVLRLGGDDDEYWNANGSPKAKKIHEDFPEYAPRAIAPQPDNKPERGSISIDDSIRRAIRGR